MGDKTNIEWTDATWNPVVGCSIVSPGCTNCYAMRQAQRIELMSDGAHSKGAGRRIKGSSHYAGTTKEVNGNTVWTGKLALAPERILTAPLRWKKPRTIFVNSMGDLFHEDCPDEWIDRVFAVMALAPQHTFQVLTKRAARMRTYCSTIQKYGRWLNMEEIAEQLGFEPRGLHDHGFDWISNKQLLPNVWLGVSVEDQRRYDQRREALANTPAAVRFLSAEPLLGPVDLHFDWQDDRFIPDWVIVGGESGRNARPMHPDWARSLRDQCAAAHVPFFFKQWGEWHPCEMRDGVGYAMHGHAPFDAWKAPIFSSETENGWNWRKVGKARAGRLLDGAEHNGMPEVRR